ncbi:lipocalin-like domain-containing protein [Herbiconiux sp. UC225_62]|uniref:lipocalin-like domain-containing protein n=1 Tax=Herbiconiux sp. UC225_62 TaxID=3350168 RepID=UPI0036D3D62A
MTTIDDLVGAWTFVSAEEVFANGARRPQFGPEAAGYLSYSPDGIVTAVLGSTSRPASSSPDPQSASDADVVAMARGFIAYGGAFTLDPETDTVTHHIDIALFPGWQGGDQVRHFTVDGDLLHGRTLPMVSPDGRSLHVELTWERVHPRTSPSINRKASS